MIALIVSYGKRTPPEGVRLVLDRCCTGDPNLGLSGFSGLIHGLTGSMAEEWIAP
jgi:hypothetical protein